MSAIILQSDIVHYEVLGRGRPVIFLHGWVGSWRYWIPAMQSASTTYRAYALDFWGFGDTAKSPERYDLEQQTNLIHGFLEELGIARVALVGHGLGAIVALLFAARYPKSADRVMSVSLPIETNQINERLHNDKSSDLAEWLLVQNPSTEAARAEAPKADERAIKASIDNLKSLDLLKLTREVDTSILLIHGQNDPAVSAPSINTNNDLPDNLHQIVFEESAHFPMLEQPTKFNRLVADFLALKSGESPRQLQLKQEWKRRVR
jgi:pimeloyl-ACP methyl ester carboxylesterase